MRTCLTLQGKLSMQTTIGPHGLALVSPQDFSVRMRKHWSETLNMPTPPALEAAHRLLAEEFQRLIVNNATDQSHCASVVLPLPTGSGKTQGTCLYASMQAELNLCATESNNSVGIVTVSYTHLRAHETRHDLVCRLLLEK